MNLALFASVFVPLSSVMAIGGSLVYHYAKWHAQTSFEKDLKELRKLWFTGDIDRKTYNYIKDNLKVEELFNAESEKLDKMLKEKDLNQFDYLRVKKILQMTLNKKLVKIENNYILDDEEKIPLQQAIN
jgi:hypothetical protein